jgi:hypothetical protein
MDAASLFKNETGGAIYTAAANDTEYNDMLRDAAKWQGLEAAKKITTNRSGLRYSGQIALKGTIVNPGDLVTVTNPFIGLNSQNLRVKSVNHQINQNKWETILNVEEDETVEA